MYRWKYAGKPPNKWGNTIYKYSSNTNLTRLRTPYPEMAAVARTQEQR
jgi:hypothetical protein